MVVDKAMVFPLPYDFESIKECPTWLMDFEKLEGPQFTERFNRRWNEGPPTIQPLLDWLKSLAVHSLVQISGSFYVVLDIPRHPNSTSSPPRFAGAQESTAFPWTKFAPEPVLWRLFAPAPCETASCKGISGQMWSFLRPLIGLKHGPRLTPLGGFRTEIEMVAGMRASTKNTGSAWEDGLFFFDTPCGNSFVLNEDGRVGKWNHETRCVVPCFEFVDAFISEYIKFQTGVNSIESPFFY